MPIYFTEYVDQGLFHFTEFVTPIRTRVPVGEQVSRKLVDRGPPLILEIVGENFLQRRVGNVS